MNSTRMILLAVALTTLGLTCSAKAYTIDRIWPLDESCRVAEGQNEVFAAHFAIGWPAGWRAVQWYKDGVLTDHDTVPSGQTAFDALRGFAWWQPGTYEVKVRAQYRSIGDWWTRYLTWNVTVFEHRPIASRVSPNSPVTLHQGATQIFRVQAEDQAGDLKGVKWYLDGVLQGDFPLSGKTAQSEWSHTFDTLGDHLVEAAVYDLYYEPVKAMWTVVVEQQYHQPSATIVSPGSPVAVYAGGSVTFKVAGIDAGNDLRLCEVLLDDVPQTNTSFSGATSGSIAEWTHTFNTPGTYRVAFVPLDLANSYGTEVVWIVVVKADPGQAGLSGMVIELDAQGRAKGPLAGAEVDITGPAAGTATTDGQGQFAFIGLNPGIYTANVGKTGFYAQSRGISLAAGETKDEVFRLTPESPEPAAFDFSSPNGKHLIEGMPGNLSFSVIVVWNGSPGSAYFNVGGTSYPAKITDLGGGKALAEVSVPSEAPISECSEVSINVTNQEGQTIILYTGVFLYGLNMASGGAFADPPNWEFSEGKLDNKVDGSYTFWDTSTWNSPLSIKAAVGFQEQVAYDPFAGTFKRLLGGSGGISMTMNLPSLEVLGEGRIGLSEERLITLSGCDTPAVESSWRLSYTGKTGVGAPVVSVIKLVFPPATVAVTVLEKTPVVGDLVKAMKFRLYLITGGALTGTYEPGEPAVCFLGTTKVTGSITVGIEGQLLIAVKRWGWNLEAGVYAGGTGTPEFQMCPEIAFDGLTLRAYAGVFASAWSFRLAQEVGMTIRFEPGDGKAGLAIASISEPYVGGAWQPIGDSCLRWGRTNLLVREGSPGMRLLSLSAQDEPSQETALVENVVPVASPVLFSGSSEKLILFCLQDPNKPWYAATDIGTVRQVNDQPWALDQITDDEVAEFSPSIVAADSGTTLAAWEQVSGDISDANEPGQIAPHLEIVAAWFEPSTGLWSTPEQLTSNAGIDSQPMAIALGTMYGILWIAGEESATAGDGGSGGRLMFVKWSGSGWDEPQTLWSAQNSIVDFAFVADDSGEGHVVLAVDEDGDPNTTTDCELYLLWTANGAWQTSIQLTSDFVEDAMPTLVAPNGVPICVWSADGTLVYSPLDDWNPRPVYSEYTLANEAPSLDGVTMPGGAAIAYTVQGPNGVDIVASFYDAYLDCWSLPRQLTSDEHAETALSLTWDVDELVIAYLKTQTMRTGMDVEIDGQMHHLENIPQPGRTDLYVLRHALANDLAVVSESMVLDPVNPAPGTAATIRATIENRGDLPLQDVDVVFYDGDPSNGGVPIGDRQVISGTLIAGGKESVSISWNVPLDESSHEIFVAVDPSLAVEDRDRSNNELSARTVLPDLTIETCWSTEVSSTTMALTARLVNTGVIPTDAFDVSWRLGAPDGEEIGKSTIGSLIAGGTYETTFIWDTGGCLNPGQPAQVFAVADSTEGIPEFDETNNVSNLAVFHPSVLSE